MVSVESSGERVAPIATHLRFENECVKVWEMDLAPGELCALHHHARDYVLYIIAGGKIAVESPGMTSNRFPGRKTYELEVGSRAISYVPAGGRESARNIGGTRFREAIFEMKLVPPGAAGNPSFALTEAIAGKEPEPGIVMLLENTRVRVSEATLMPGGTNPLHLDERDAVVFAIKGGRLATVEADRFGTERSRDELIQPSAVFWRPRGFRRSAVNLGNERYRELSVEFR